MRRIWITIGFAFGGVFGCGGAHQAMRPTPPTAAEATGRSTIKAVEGPSSPLIVDWKAEQRADLEEAVHDGVAVVAWDDQGLRLLKHCKLTGNYGYLPVQAKKDVVRLESADEVQANLPLGGLGIVGKIGGEFASGTTLDIALAMVGKRRTTWNDVSKDDLVGSCDGATHYVRAILVGAFAMKTGSKAKAAAAAEIFGAGASGESSSAKDIATSDGKLESCEQATGEENKPPSQCGAILRLELEPIAKSGHATRGNGERTKQEQQPKAEVVAACPPGLIFSNGACKSSRSAAPHACAPGDIADCRAQCNKGDAASCDRLGSLIAAGKQGTPDPRAARSVFEKACNAGYANACANFGLSLLFGRERDPNRGMAALEKGCLGGSARACELAGEVALDAKDARKALGFYVKGCEGGDYIACTNAGFLYAGGGGAAVPRDDQKAIGYAQRACFGGNATACGNAGYKIEIGESVAPNPKLALSLYERACKLEPSECFRIGFLLSTGASGIPKDDQKARAYLDTACKAGSGMACVVASLHGGAQKPSPAALSHTASIMKPQCDQKDGRACTFLGIAEYGQAKKSAAAGHLKDACAFRDPLGCELAKKLK